MAGDMLARDILTQRLYTQRVAGTPFERPEDMVQWLGGVQAQDYAGARWSVGQRTKNGTDAAVAQAFDAGKILRTHLLRPTWHFVTPADIRWLLELTAPHIKRLNAYYYCKLELTAAVFARSQTVLTAALEGGKQRTRLELAAFFAQAGIVADKLRLSYLLMDAELNGLICSGAVRGKQQTYTLLEERAPHATTRTPDEALAELALRFFVSHGPATVQDYVRWSGLSVAAAKQGLAMVQRRLEQEVVAGHTYWFSPSLPSMQPAQSTATTAYLLPEYDECLLTYKDLTFPDLPWAKGQAAWRDSYYRPIIIDDQRAGTWRRTIATGRVLIETNLFAELNTAQAQALQAAVERYGRFMNLPVSLA